MKLLKLLAKKLFIIKLLAQMDILKFKKYQTTKTTHASHEGNYGAFGTLYRF